MSARIQGTLNASRWMSIGIAMAIETSTAFAAHPLVTEDTATQGSGNVELENGFSFLRVGPASLAEYQPQFSLGASSVFDVIVQPAFLETRLTGVPATQGFGDTNLDIKWRFFGAAPWSLALRTGITLSTNEHEVGLPHGRNSEHAVLVLTYEEAPLALHMNAGYALNPRSPELRRDLGHVSSAVMWTVNEKLILTSEVALDSNADPMRSAWSGSYLAGIIYTSRPGLDIDSGFQIGIGPAPSARTWLAGITYRFAL